MNFAHTGQGRASWNQDRIEEEWSSRRYPNCTPEDFSHRTANLSLSEVEIAIVRVGPVVHGVTGLEHRTGGHACTEQSFEVWLGRDEIIPIGDIDPPPRVWREPRRPWSEPRVNDCLEAEWGT